MEMECYCDPGEFDGTTDVWNVSWRRAKRQYRCCECHEPILPGEKHEYIFAVCNDDPMQFRTCEFCANEYERLRQKHPDLCWLKGNDDLACALVWDIRNETRESTR